MPESTPEDGLGTTFPQPSAGRDFSIHPVGEAPRPISYTSPEVKESKGREEIQKKTPEDSTGPGLTSSSGLSPVGLDSRLDLLGRRRRCFVPWRETDPRLAGQCPARL